MNEKEAIERATAEAFLDHYNDTHVTLFRVTEHGDAPDIIARDELGNRLQLEIVMTEDRVGDIKATLGRSDSRSIESLRRHVELVRQGKAEPRASSLATNVTESLKQRLQAKMKKRYGPNTALVIRDTSGVDWDWDLVVDEIKASFGDQLNPFDRGIWLLNRSKDRLFQLLACSSRLNRMALDSNTPGMGIDLRVETESGAVLAEVGDPHGCVGRFLMMSDLETTASLRFIDPYGDTVFNRSQMPVVHSEIEAALPRLSVARLRSEREKMLKHAIDARWQQSVIDRLRADVETDWSRSADLEEIRGHMRRILEAVRQAITSGPHVYLKFVGD